MGSRLSSPYEVSGRSYTKPLTFHSLAPPGPSITWRVQWKLFSPNIKSYLGAFKTQQIYVCKRSLFACLRALHFIYRADIKWCTGTSKTVYIHSKIHFCDTHTTVSPELRALWTLLIPCLCSYYSSLHISGLPHCPDCLRYLPTSSSQFFCLGSLRCLNMLLQAAIEGHIIGLKLINLLIHWSLFCFWYISSPFTPGSSWIPFWEKTHQLWHMRPPPCTHTKEITGLGV